MLLPLGSVSRKKFVAAVWGSCCEWARLCGRRRCAWSDVFGALGILVRYDLHAHCFGTSGKSCFLLVFITNVMSPFLKSELLYSFIIWLNDRAHTWMNF